MENRIERATSRQRKLVLVAEDDHELLLTLMQLVEELGVGVVGVTDGEQLLAWVEPLILHEDGGDSPDILITDLRMPGFAPIDILDGLSLAGANVRVIVVSGANDPALRERVRQLGYAWVDKPVATLQLERAIRDVLAQCYSRASM